MIPRAHITAWRARAPWPTDAQVEQDLVLSRALATLFSEPALARALAFRGGTALHKLFLARPGRYSEDIDLVQTNPAPIGPMFDAIRHLFEPWLGVPSRKQGAGRATLTYRFETTARPVQQAKLKIEINTREHFAVHGYRQRRLEVENPWFSGAAEVNTFEVEEILATKVRALYQRKKGRDLYDLWRALTTLEINDARVVEDFMKYMEHGGHTISRAVFEANLAAKLDMKSFLADVGPTLAAGEEYDAARAGVLVHERLIAKLPGEVWKGAAPFLSPT